MSRQPVTITVSSLKLAVPLRASQLPADLVPADGPAGEPTIDGGPVCAGERGVAGERKDVKAIAGGHP
jgi:hypothetical protein